MIMEKFDAEKDDALRDIRVIELIACACNCTVEDVKKGITRYVGGNNHG